MSLDAPDAGLTVCERVLHDGGFMDATRPVVYVEGCDSFEDSCRFLAQLIEDGEPVAFEAGGCGSRYDILIAPASAWVTDKPTRSTPFVAVRCGSRGGLYQVPVWPRSSSPSYLAEKFDLLDGDAAAVGFLLDQIGEHRLRWRERRAA